jgi:hypothetical protein
MSISLPIGVQAKAPERTIRKHQASSGGQLQLESRLEVQQAVLQRGIVDLGQSLRALERSLGDDVNAARTSARDANDRLEKQMERGFQVLDGRIAFIKTLLVLIFTALLAVLGGALLIWRELIKLEQNLAHRLAMVEQRVVDVVEESKKRIIGP